MNVYDFDGTVYRGDSTVDFYLYCARVQPRVLRALPGQARAIWRYAMRLADKTEMKQGFFGFLPYLKEPDATIAAFWDGHMRKLKPWYLAQKRKDDVIASASPEFLVAPACERLGLPKPVASRVDARTGRYTGRNCRGEEKAARFRERYPGAEPEAFYSDNRSDVCMARLAKAAYRVRGNRSIPWRDGMEREGAL